MNKSMSSEKAFEHYVAKCQEQRNSIFKSDETHSTTTMKKMLRESTLPQFLQELRQNYATLTSTSQHTFFSQKARAADMPMGRHLF